MARRHNPFPAPCAVQLDDDEFASLALDLHLASVKHPDDETPVILTPMVMSLRLTLAIPDGTTNYYCVVRDSMAGGAIHLISHAVRMDLGMACHNADAKKVWNKYMKGRRPALPFIPSGGRAYAWVPVEPLDLSKQITKNPWVTSDRILNRLKSIRTGTGKGTLMVIDQIG